MSAEPQVVHIGEMGHPALVIPLEHRPGTAAACQLHGPQVDARICANATMEGLRNGEIPARVRGLLGEIPPPDHLLMGEALRPVIDELTNQVSTAVGSPVRCSVVFPSDSWVAAPDVDTREVIVLAGHGQARVDCDDGTVVEVTTTGAWIGTRAPRSIVVDSGWTLVIEADRITARGLWRYVVMKAGWVPYLRCDVPASIDRPLLVHGEPAPVAYADVLHREVQVLFDRATAEEAVAWLRASLVEPQDRGRLTDVVRGSFPGGVGLLPDSLQRPGRTLMVAGAQVLDVADSLLPLFAVLVSQRAARRSALEQLAVDPRSTLGLLHQLGYLRPAVQPEVDL